MKTAIYKWFVLLITISSFKAFTQDYLSAQEVNDIIYMLEEEKLSRDVYEFLDAKWDLMVFNNLKQSEQHHMEMVEYLLSNYKVSYKISNESGVFYNNKMQKLYDDLIEKGSKSEYDALEVGKTIELVDIKDLENAMKQTTNSEIKGVYSRLIFGSNNHLRAFNRNLSRF